MAGKTNTVLIGILFVTGSITTGVGVAHVLFWDLSCDDVRDGPYRDLCIEMKEEREANGGSAEAIFWLGLGVFQLCWGLLKTYDERHPEECNLPDGDDA